MDNPLSNDDRQFVSLFDVEAVLSRAWHDERPFSLVRVGDGELSTLLYPSGCSEERIQHVFRRAMTDRHYSSDEVVAVQQDMRRAVQCADLVGLYDSFEPNDLCATYQEDLDMAGRSEGAFCNAQVHLALQSSGALHRLLEKAPRVTLITGRDLATSVAARYPTADVDQLLVPVERQYVLADMPGSATGDHLGAHYRTVLDRITPEGPHHLCLVGAGLLGKAYCQRVKETGGFALDIGSVMDYWADTPTREGRRVVEDGRPLVRTSESRWPNMALGADAAGHPIMATPHRGMYRPMAFVPRPVTAAR